MLTYSKIFNNNIPANDLSKDWQVQDSINWAREDMEYGYLNKKQKIKLAFEILFMHYLPKIYNAYVLHECRKYQIDIVDLDDLLD